MDYSVQHAQYLYRRDSGIYFARFVVPARLREAVGHRELHRTTGCRDLRLAKIVAGELAALWHRALAAVEHMDLSKVQAGSLALLGDGFIGLTEAAAELGATPLSLLERLIERRQPVFVRAVRWTGWAVDDVDLFDQAYKEFDDLRRASWVISAESLDKSYTSQAFSGRLQLRHPEEAVGVLRGEQDSVCQFYVWPSRAQLFVVDYPGQTLTGDDLEVERASVEGLRSQLASQFTLQTPSQGAPKPGSAVVQQTGMRFSDLAREHLKWNKPHWKADQYERRTEQCRIFEELMEDPPLGQIDRSLMRRFMEVITELPADRHLLRRRFKLEKTTGVRALIDIAREHEWPKLTPGAQHRLLAGMSELFAWGVREQLMAANPAIGLGSEVTRGVAARAPKDHEQRDAFSPDDLAKIFGVEWFANGVGRATPGGRYFAYRPHYYWLPLLALFEGGRLNELSQLYLRDVPIIDGVACLDFNLEGEGKEDLDEADSAGGDKSLKTVNARRIVPIHARLIELGFLDYVNALAAAGHVRLFPELKHDARKGYGKAAGSWFNERFLGNRLGIPRDGRKTFHSFRHNFATALAEVGIETTLKADFMGHHRSDAMAEFRYDKGRQIAFRRQEIDRIAYPLPVIAKFDTAAALLAVNDALALKRGESELGSSLRA